MSVYVWDCACHAGPSPWNHWVASRRVSSHHQRVFGVPFVLSVSLLRPPVIHPRRPFELSFIGRSVHTPWCPIWGVYFHTLRCRRSHCILCGFRILIVAAGLGAPPVPLPSLESPREWVRSPLWRLESDDRPRRVVVAVSGTVTATQIVRGLVGASCRRRLVVIGQGRSSCGLRPTDRRASQCETFWTEL